MTYMVIINKDRDTAVLDLGDLKEGEDVWDALYRLNSYMYGLIDTDDVYEVTEDLWGIPGPDITTSEELREFMGVQA